MLTGKEIARQVGLGRITIDPFSAEQVGPNSYDLRLGNKLANYVGVCVLDPKKPAPVEEYEISDAGHVLLPHKFYLAHTLEFVGSDHYVPVLHGRSSAARLGVSVHLSSDLGETGNVCQWTLEVVVPYPVRIYPGLRICQVTFEEVTGEITLYSGKYLGQKDPTPSRWHQDKELKDV